MKLSAAEIETVRSVAKLKFAREFAPDAFEGYPDDRQEKPAARQPTASRQ